MQRSEIIFDVRQSPEGGYEARALGHSIFTEADDWEQLKKMVRDAVLCHFEDGEAPRMVRIHQEPTSYGVTNCLDALFPQTNNGTIPEEVLI